MASWECLGNVLGASWGILGTSWERLGSILRGVLGAKLHMHRYAMRVETLPAVLKPPLGTVVAAIFAKHAPCALDKSPPPRAHFAQHRVVVEATETPAV